MKILIATVRKAPRREDYRMRLEYVKNDGKLKTFSLLFPTREEAENKLAFRIKGLKNGGKKI